MEAIDSPENNLVVKKYVHAGLRMHLNGLKCSAIFILDENGILIPTENNYKASDKEKILLGHIFEGEFSENTATLSHNKDTSLGVYADEDLLLAWSALQTQALSRVKVKALKADMLNDLAVRLKPERSAYHAAIKRGDYESAQSIKSLIELVLTKP